MRIKNIFSFVFLLICIHGFAQEPSLYIRSLRSIHLENKPLVPQQIKFRDVDMVYNKIGQFLNERITVSSSGIFEVSAFANINPGVMGSSSKDSIHIELYVMKNHNQPTEQVIGTTVFKYSYGSFDVAAGLMIPPKEIQLQQGDEISLWVKILPSTTIDINKSSKYDHVNKPTGMEQIAGIRIAKVL